MTGGINRTDAWYIAVIMACGFITFYSLPDAMPFLVRLTMMVVTQVAVGKAPAAGGAAMIPIYTRWRIGEAFWIRTRTPVSDRVNPLGVVDILDDPFDETAELVHDLPERVVQCHTCFAELPELNRCTSSATL